MFFYKVSYNKIKYLLMIKDEYNKIFFIYLIKNKLSLILLKIL